MEKYFISKGTEKKGPFSIEDLLKMEITEDYLIWKDEFEKWIPISEIELLKSHIIKLPPELPTTKNENIGFDFKKNLKLPVVHYQTKLIFRLFNFRLNRNLFRY